jgi:hypothetical protein
MLTYSDVCWRMLTYADVCVQEEYAAFAAQKHKENAAMLRESERQHQAN